MMSGITFYGTAESVEVIEFYTQRLGAERWLEQPDCTILKYDNMLLGFCSREQPETDGTITFVVDDRAAVDAVYAELRDQARGPPRENEQYDIYHFYANDPEGRAVEVQTFLHPTEPV